MEARTRCTAVVVILGVSLVWSAAPIMAQRADSGTISGVVTADRGDVRAFRVKARDSVHKIIYTVFTNGGRYQIYNLPPSTYDVQVLEVGFDSPVRTVDLKTGDAITVDLVLTVNGVTAPRGEGGFGESVDPSYGAARQARSLDGVELVEFDELYPPDPARDIMMKACFGCHGPDGQIGQAAFHMRGRKNEAAWRRSVNRMFGAGPDGWLGGEHGLPLVTTEMVTPEQKESLIRYLTENFGPASEPRDLKLDPLVRNEAALSRAIYIEYEGPSGHDPAPSPVEPGVVCLSGSGNDTIVCIDTNNPDPETRATEFKIPSPDGGRLTPHGIIMDGRGTVYWSELRGDHIGQLDPKTGEIERYRLPTPGGGAHTLRADSRGGIWYSNFSAASSIGRLDLATGEVTEFEPLNRFSSYGITVDRQDRVWAVQIGSAASGTPGILMYNQETGDWKNYPTTNPSRRLDVDSRGHVWSVQYFGNRIAMIDPSTNTVTEYDLPLKYGNPYEVMVDLEDNLWIENATYNSLVKFDQETEEFTYFPFPQIAAHTPKIEVDAQGTLWFPLGRYGLTAFKSEGNVPQAN